jgi:cob(I)alamin adenosyltransferase
MPADRVDGGAAPSGAGAHIICGHARAMVYLSRIYTKTGDDGTTALGDGRRVPKDHARVAAYGSVDELNAALGLALAARPARLYAGLLRSIQNDLFDLGADLCVPESGQAEGGGAEPAGETGRGAGGGGNAAALRVRGSQVERLERAIDAINSKLKPLRSFVLPGGSPLAAWLHLARTVCRRAEREVVALARQEKVNPQAAIYLNRLSDLLFVMARAASHDRETLWVPGGGSLRGGRSGGRQGAARSGEGSGGSSDRRRGSQTRRRR